MEKKDLVLIHLNGADLYTTVTKKYQNRKQWSKPDPRIISSVIPGAILDILVKEGDKVKAGQTLLVLESMKMANQIKATLDGKVKKISVSKGEVIPKGHVMVELS